MHKLRIEKPRVPSTLSPIAYIQIILIVLSFTLVEPALWWGTLLLVFLPDLYKLAFLVYSKFDRAKPFRSATSPIQP